MQIVFFYLILAMTSLRQNSKENDLWRNIALNVSLFRLNDINATKAQNCYAGFFPCLSQQRNIWHDWNSAFVARDALNWKTRRNCWFFLRISLLSLSAHVHWLCGVCISAGVDEQPKFEDVWGCDVHDCGVLRRWHVFYSSFPFLSFPPFLLHCDQLFVFPSLHFLYFAAGGVKQKRTIVGSLQNLFSPRNDPLCA